MRQEAQLDLGIVGHHQFPASFGDKGSANFPAFFRANRYVLKVWVGGRQTPGGRARLVESGMQTSRFGSNQLGKRVNISSFQLRQLPIIENQLRDWIGR